MTSRVISELRRGLLLPRRAAGEPRAVFSPCRRYRYRLLRVWDPAKPRLGWVMLASPKANEHRDDPTVRRGIGFARAGGYGGVDLANLDGFVSKTPAALADQDDPVGPDNDEHRAAVCADNDLTVMAWGAGAQPGRAHHVAVLLWRLCITHRRSLAVLGWTLAGQPSHPLCVPGSTSPECLTVVQISQQCPGWGYHDDPHRAQPLGHAAGAHLAHRTPRPPNTSPPPPTPVPPAQGVTSR